MFPKTKQFLKTNLPAVKLFSDALLLLVTTQISSSVTALLSTLEAHPFQRKQHTGPVQSHTGLTSLKIVTLLLFLLSFIVAAIIESKAKTGIKNIHILSIKIKKVNYLF
jgi:hypothetical protein